MASVATYNELQSRHHADKLRAILSFANSSDAIRIVVDDNGIICAWSIGAEEFFHRPRSAAVGMGVGIVIPLEMSEAHLKGFSKRVKNPQTDYVQIVNCQLDNGQKVQVTLTSERIGSRQYFLARIAPAENVKIIDR